MGDLHDSLRPTTEVVRADPPPKAIEYRARDPIMALLPSRLLL